MRGVDHEFTYVVHSCPTHQAKKGSMVRPTFRPYIVLQARVLGLVSLRRDFRMNFIYYQLKDSSHTNPRLHPLQPQSGKENEPTRKL